MTGSVAEISRLVPLLDMAFQAEQITMSQINAKIATLRAQLQNIERRPAMPADILAPAVRVGADMLWQSWVQDRKTMINRDLALALRDKERARENMIRALSKLQAAKNLESRLMKQSQKQAERRASW